MRRFIKSFLLISIVTLSGLLFSASAMAASTDRQTTGANCNDPYAIMCGGAGDHEAMVNYINHADPKLNYKAIYAKYGLAVSEYNRFAIEAKHGKILKDGSIVVGGKTVGRSTMNIGRTQTSTFNKRVTINGQNYWGGSFDDTYHADTADVLVLMKAGKLQFAAITSCGNPQQLAPPQPPAPEPEPTPTPTYACTNLRKERVQGNRYSFTTNASAAGGARVVKAVYDFGDGNTRTVSDLSTPIEHTFTRSATVRVTVHVRLPGGGTKIVAPAGDCITQVTVVQQPQQPPEQPQSSAYCSEFKTPVLINEDQRLYRFTVVANTSNARFDRADFRFSDNQNAVMPAAPNGSNQAIINHAFPATGNYTVTATLHFTGADGRQFSGDCVSQVSITGAPEQPAQVVENECDNNDEAGKDCAELVDAGPGAIVAGIFGGASTLAAAGHFIIRRRLFGL